MRASPNASLFVGATHEHGDHTDRIPERRRVRNPERGAYAPPRRRRAATLAALVSSVAWCGLGIARADDSWPGPTVPAKAPKDIKVGVVACEAQFRGCYAPALAAAEAAKALGWTVTVYDGASAQEKQNNGILDALSSGANLVLTAALDPELIQLGLSKAKEAGVAVVSSSAGTNAPTR
jgi:ABC-type sugar transport system substrate-binding protein